MNKCIIIAEAGVNHNGSLQLAKKLVISAAKAKADFVKFQTYTTDRLVSKTAEKAGYQSNNLQSADNSQFEMLKKYELSKQDFSALCKLSKKCGIGFLSSPFDEESVDFLVELGVSIIKIPSGEITNIPLLEHIGKKKLSVILSTGLSNLDEISFAIDTLSANGTDVENITLLHCNSQYPTPFKDVNIKAMHNLALKFGTKTGYSDHTIGLEIPVAAVALGATVIEKHFTLSRKLAGPDHLVSLEPRELRDMVKMIRNVELALSGDGSKNPSESEILNLAAVRKSIHLAKNIKKGEKIDRDLLIMLRPGDGIAPGDLPRVIGRKVKKDLEKGNKLKWEDLSE